MMTEFWTNINTHPYRSSRDPLDWSTLLLYQVEQRKLWHQAINSPDHGYNLSQINKDLLCQPKDRQYWMEREQKDITFGKDYIVIVLDSSRNISLTMCGLFLHYLHYQMCSATHNKHLFHMSSQMVAVNFLHALFLCQLCHGL